MTVESRHAALAAGLRPAPGARVPLRARHAVPGPGRGGAVREVRPAAVARASAGASARCPSSPTLTLRPIPRRPRAPRILPTRRYGDRGRWPSTPRTGDRGATGRQPPRPPGRSVPDPPSFDLGTPRERSQRRDARCGSCGCGRGCRATWRWVRSRFLVAGRVCAPCSRGRLTPRRPQPSRPASISRRAGFAESFARAYLSWDADAAGGVRAPSAHATWPPRRSRRPRRCCRRWAASRCAGRRWSAERRASGPRSVVTVAARDGAGRRPPRRSGEPRRARLHARRRGAGDRRRRRPSSRSGEPPAEPEVEDAGLASGRDAGAAQLPRRRAREPARRPRARRGRLAAGRAAAACAPSRRRRG